MCYKNNIELKNICFLGNVKIEVITKDRQILKKISPKPALNSKSNLTSEIKVYLFRKDNGFPLFDLSLRKLASNDYFDLWQDKNGDLFAKIKSYANIYRIFFAILMLKNNFLLHSSSVIKNGQGILFIGHSGSGKSTLAKGMCKLGFRQVSDDISLIYKDSLKNRVFAKGCDVLDNKTNKECFIPNRIIFPRIVNKAKSSAIRLLNRESFFRLLKYFPKEFIFKKNLTTSYLFLLWKLVKQSHSYVLNCGKDIKNNHLNIFELIDL